MCLNIMQVEDPNVLTQMGNKIFPTVEWEEKKADMMKCVVLSKFGHNPDLNTKLKATGSTPLYECTRNRYWGTGWKHDAPNWEKSSNFPGKNILGNILMEIRDNVEEVNQPESELQSAISEVIIKDQVPLETEMVTKEIEHRG